MSPEVQAFVALAAVVGAVAFLVVRRLRPRDRRASCPRCREVAPEPSTRHRLPVHGAGQH